MSHRLEVAVLFLTTCGFRFCTHFDVNEIEDSLTTACSGGGSSMSLIRDVLQSFNDVLIVVLTDLEYGLLHYHSSCER